MLQSENKRRNPDRIRVFNFSPGESSVTPTLMKLKFSCNVTEKKNMTWHDKTCRYHEHLYYIWCIFQLIFSWNVRGLYFCLFFAKNSLHEYYVYHCWLPEVYFYIHDVSRVGSTPVFIFFCGLCMNWTPFRKKRSCTNRRTIPTLDWIYWEKPRKKLCQDR
jgi:hypothetical protein